MKTSMVTGDDRKKPNPAKISEFTLERYRLGELRAKDKQAVEEALTRNEDLRSRLEKMDESDRVLRQCYPAEFFNLENAGLEESYSGLEEPHSTDSNRTTPQFLKRLFASGKARGRLALIAAVFLLCIFFPVLYFLLNRTSGTAEAGGFSPDRAEEPALAKPELSLYLKGDGEIPVHDRALLQKGNTVKVAYTTPDDSVYYGVIFSIDGRSQVTMHYPYRKEQEPLLVSGRRTFLDEAYILDDAPAYEIFTLVVSKESIDVEAVLQAAQKMGEEIKRPDLMSIGEKSKIAFQGCDVETVTVLKK